MKTKNTVETNTETSKFGYYDLEKEEFYPIETDDDIKKYAKKLKNGLLLSCPDDMFDLEKIIDTIELTVSKNDVK